MSVLDLGTWVDVPARWPESLHPTQLAALDLPTPYLIGDNRLLRERLSAFESALPGVRPFYAVKCNSDRTVLQHGRVPWSRVRDRVSRRARHAAGSRGRPS